MSGAISPLPNTPSWRGPQLKKQRDNLLSLSLLSFLLLFVHLFISLFLYHYVSASFVFSFVSMFLYFLHRPYS
jgi:hypothetical protein